MSSSTNFVPSRESELVTWLKQLAAKVTLAPTQYGTTAAMATALQNAVDAFVESYEKANSNDTRTPAIVTLKNTNKDLAVVLARQVAGVIQKFPGTTDEMRRDLSITVAKPRTPIAAPTQTPVVVVDSVIGRTVWLNIFQADGETRSMPEGVRSVMVYSYIGADPVPDGITKWQIQGLCTKTRCSLEFAASVPAGSKVWLTAAWLSPRDASGPACTPISVYLGGGPAVQVG